MELIVKGAEDLARVSAALKQAGDRELRKEMLRGIRESGKPIVKQIKQEAGRQLPQRGGLAASVSRSRFSTRTRTSGKSVGVRIEGTSRTVRNLRRLDAGRLRHPVYGNRGTWVEQSIPAGWFSKPVEAGAREVRQGVTRVLEDIARRVERSV